jgi:hypothetical protein
MFDSGVHCITGLVLAAAILLCLVRRLSQDDRQELPRRVNEPVGSKAGIAILLLASLLLVASLGSIAGVVTWEALKGMAGLFTASPKIFVAASVGAAASVIGFALFALVISLLGPIMSTVYEEWTAYMAPVVGGAAGAAVSGGLGIILTIPLGALTGGVALLFYETLTTKERITFKGVTELALAGMGFGVINGVIVATIFKVLEMTVGLDWLLAG